MGGTEIELVIKEKKMRQKKLHTSMEQKDWDAPHVHTHTHREFTSTHSVGVNSYGVYKCVCAL